MKTFLTKTELEIMQYIWNVNSEVTATDIREHFSNKNWSKQAVGTFLKKLVDTKFLKVRRLSITKYYYSAALTEQQYSMLPAKDILEHVFNNSLSKFVCALLPSDSTKEDILELEKLLSAYENKLVNTSHNDSTNQNI